MLDRQRVVVKVDELTKSFKIPTEASSGLKQKIINFIKGKKGYRIFTPLNKVSFEVYEGDFFGIVGRNGSGKSTLLKTISGIYTPTDGAVHVAGTLVPFIELGVGFNPELTGRENVFLNGALLGFSQKEMDKMYDSIVDFAEIGDFMDEKLKNYSSGMQVRLAFSIAIQAKGDILVLDEVLAVGDAAFQQKCFDYFEKLKSDKRTVILVTHDMSSVQRFCNRAMMLESGSIKAIGDPNEIADIYTEDNIRRDRPASEDDPEEALKDSGRSIRLKLEDTPDSIIFHFTCNFKQDDDLYIGFSLFMNGPGFAELNSKSIQLREQKLTYRLDKKLLNPGAYEVAAGMFKRDNQELIAICKGRKRFMIHGSDKVRGAAMRLPEAWEQ